MFSVCIRCCRKAEAGVHIEQRRPGSSDHLLAPGGTQGQHPHVQYDWRRCGLREPYIRLPRDWLWGNGASVTIHERWVCFWLTIIIFYAYLRIRQAVNWFLYSYITPIFWVRILYSEKPPIFPIFSYILNIIPIFFSELVAALSQNTFFFCSLCSHFRLN